MNKPMVFAKSTTTPVRHEQMRDNDGCDEPDVAVNTLHWKILSILTLGAMSLTLWASEVLDIRDAWTPEAPPGRMMAGFMTLHNPGPKPVVIKAAESENFGRVEIHTMTMDDGVMRMRRLERLEIEPGATVRLEPGSIHLMLMQPEGPLTSGNSFAITLITEDGNRLELVSTVRPRRP